MTLHSQKKKDKFYWLIAILFFVLAYACGPSKEAEYNKKQTEIQLNCKSTEFQTILTQGINGCANYTMLKYYDSKGHEYIGHISNSSSDYITHSGDCKYCYKKDSLLIVSTLHKFFQTSKK